MTWSFFQHFSDADGCRLFNPVCVFLYGRTRTFPSIYPEEAGATLVHWEGKIPLHKDQRLRLSVYNTCIVIPGVDFVIFKGPGFVFGSIHAEFGGSLLNLGKVLDEI